MGDIMRIVATLTLVGGLTLAGGAAFAWSDIYTGDATNDPNSNFLMHAYDAPNMCPEGLQPVMAGGAICCGVPNAGAYIDRPGKAHRAHRSPAGYAPVGEKGVVYR
jgi:hypothetical protein